MENTEMMLAADVRNEIVSGLKESDNVMFTSFTPDDVNGKKRLYNAVTASGKTIKSMVNQPIYMVDAIVSVADVVNEDGTSTNVPRTVLIDKDGECYTATSWGVYRSLQKLQAIFGALHFDEPLAIKPVEVQTKKGYTINFALM